MPYIKQEQRKQLDAEIDALTRRIVQMSGPESDETSYMGLLNYACSRIAAGIVLQKFGGIRYKVVAMMTGVFHNIADEFYRRLGAPYEDKVTIQNGDVDLYAELLDKMAKK
jgi:hypothetical protein